MNIEPCQVLVVGAGPAGVALAYLLARAGVTVRLVERHRDFAREFRGEGLQPSGLEALRAMGFTAALEGLPHVRVGDSEIYHRKRRVLRIPAMQDGLTLVSQPDLLHAITEAARAYPGFRLNMDTNAQDVVQDADGRITGVRCSMQEGSRELRADLVIGTDGRGSTLRARAGVPMLEAPQEFDVLWFKVERMDPADTVARAVMGEGSAVVIGPSADGRMQIGWIVPKARGHMRAHESFDALLDLVPGDVGAHLRARRAVLGKPTFLRVVCHRAVRWTVPGLLLLGDAAHPMSPIGGQGINIALRDAIVATNHLCPALVRGAKGPDLDRLAAAVQAEREPEVKKIQRLQTQQGKRMFMSRGVALQMQVALLSLVGRLGLAGRMAASSPFTRGVTDVTLRV